MPTPRPSAGSTPCGASASTGIPFFGRRHLEAVLHSFESHYNSHRPHRALGVHAHDPSRPTASPTVPDDPVQPRDRLCGLTHEHRLTA